VPRNRPEGVPIRSLAVLPLANLSGDPSQEYFADGMTEEVTTMLSKVSALKVISRTSAMQFKGTRMPLREIAAALGVEGVIEGSVLRSGGRVRVTAQLIDAGTDAHVWAQSYEREMEDVLVLQGEIARAIVSEVRARLTPQEEARLGKARTVNPEAYGLVLRGRHQIDVGGDEGRTALEPLERAIALDPTYAPAHAAVAMYHVWTASRGREPGAEAIPKARAAARRALELDEGSAEAHACLGAVMGVLEWDWAGAERELRRAIELDPNRSEARLFYARYLTAVGRLEEAIAQQRRAVELDPLSALQHWWLGTALRYARRHDEAIAAQHEAMRLDPSGVGPWARAAVAWNHAEMHRHDEALAECGPALEAAPDVPFVMAVCAGVYGLTGRREESLVLLHRLETSPWGRSEPYRIAFVHDCLGDTDRTIEWLERAVADRSPVACFLGVGLWSDRLRSDPRFKELVRRMKYPGPVG
jgi:TolB-like protein/Tfp pilus assembly protein PilF